MAKIDKQDLALKNYTPGQKWIEGDNRRIKGERVHLSFPVYGKTLKGELFSGYIESLNISWSGMMVESNIVFNIADEFFIEFTLPNLDAPLSIKSKVIWIHDHPHEEALHVMGLAFLEMDINIRRMLNGFVLEHLADDL